MSDIGKLWAGRVYGTNTGNLFIEFQKVNSEVTGTFRFMDSVFGLCVYSIQGTFDDTLKLTGNSTQGVEGGVEKGELTAEAKLTPEGNLRGT